MIKLKVFYAELSSDYYTITKTSDNIWYIAFESLMCTLPSDGDVGVYVDGLWRCSFWYTHEKEGLTILYDEIGLEITLHRHDGTSELLECIDTPQNIKTKQCIQGFEL